MFFKEKEDLKAIIDDIIHNSGNIKKYSTGWTNIVLEATGDEGTFIFRFPRNDFFSKQIEKDVLANKFIRSKIPDFKTIDLNIKYDKKGRPFSVHRKVEGTSLTDRFNFLSLEKKNEIAKEVAECFSKIHSINVDLANTPDKLSVKISKFLYDLSKVDDEYYDYSMLEELEKDENNSKKVFVYGDLNIGNVLLNEEDKIVAFLDFSFFGLSDIYTDLSRISCRVDDVFMDEMINTYEKITDTYIDKDKIRERNKMWSYVEKQYIKYMKKYFPEIELPVEK